LGIGHVAFSKLTEQNFAGLADCITPYAVPRFAGGTVRQFRPQNMDRFFGKATYLKKEKRFAGLLNCFFHFTHSGNCLWLKFIVAIHIRHNDPITGIRHGKILSLSILLKLKWLTACLEKQRTQSLARLARDTILILKQ